MKRFALMSLALLGTALVLGMQSPDAKPEQGAKPAETKPAETKPDWSAALAKLDPARPRGYFELAEDIADAATTGQEKELARTLFGLAGTLGRDEFARSSALALAAMADDARRRRSLLALAVLLTSDANGGAGDVVVFDASEQRPSVAAAVALSEAFSFYRRGQGTRAIGALKNAEVEALLNRFGSGLPGGAERFREDCRAYRGGVRPEPQRAAKISMLTIEEAALSAAGGDERTKPREWSSLLLETSSRPFVEIDASRLDEAFGVDPTRPYWREGHWAAEK